MTTFQVTPADLQSFAGQLSGLLGELEQASGGLGAGAGGAAANAQLEGAIDAFLIDWSQGLDQLQSKLAQLSQRLEAGASIYETTESKLTSNFRGS